MSNGRKLRAINPTSGRLQRHKIFWSGNAGNPTTQRLAAERAEEEKKPQFILQPKGTK